MSTKSSDPFAWLGHGEFDINLIHIHLYVSSEKEQHSSSEYLMKIYVTFLAISSIWIIIWKQYHGIQNVFELLYLLIKSWTQ